MAEVWRGHDLILQRPVAVKLLHPHLASDPLLVERFRREAISAARLSHPHIVPTYDAGTDGETAYIILGLIHGPTLAEVLKKAKLETQQALSVARQIADALDHAHRAGLVHRDVKPSNVLVVGDDYRIMVADFGIAKALADSADESLTLPGLVIGTPAYLAPEQASGRDADGRSDIYATGVVLHEMLCGHTSVDAPTQLEAPDEQAAGPVHCDQLAAGPAAIVERATQHDPEDRYQTAALLSEDLHALEKSGESSAYGSPIRMPIQPLRPPRQKTTSTRWTSEEDTNEHAALKPAPAPAPVNAAPPAPSRHWEEPAVARSRRPFVYMAIAVALIGGAIGVGRLVSEMGNEKKPAPAPILSPLALTSPKSFDPAGDGSENEGAAGRALDGNPATVWNTERYATRSLGGLKPGVGLIASTASSTKMTRLTVESSSTGWAAAIYVSDSPKATLAEWGSAVDQQSGLGASVNFDMHGAAGSAILVWIVDLGSANRMTISEMRLSN